ncbi:hypothetical protein Ocin01_13563 [Orchesella cincta]|uniref:Uncharacterized protein n=1 Tax=Orchesella cincta TaxID=48709 RepID=A0A1D2MJE9_ORCCI|nr:hypothetical protein Ocin01_13563 [Orchesella cincta]
MSLIFNSQACGTASESVMGFSLFPHLLMILIATELGTGARGSWNWRRSWRNGHMYEYRSNYHYGPCYLEGSTGSRECPPSMRLHPDYPGSMNGICKPEKTEPETSYHHEKSQVRDRYPMCGSREEKRKDKENPIAVKINS